MATFLTTLSQLPPPAESFMLACFAFCFRKRMAEDMQLRNLSPRTIDAPAGLGPPRPDCPPSVMLKYLTRYLTGGPISDRRIVGERDGRIYFTARSKRKGEGPVEVSLSRVEFVRQWSLHMLPKGVRNQARAGQAMSWKTSIRR